MPGFADLTIATGHPQSVSGECRSLFNLWREGTIIGKSRTDRRFAFRSGCLTFNAVRPALSRLLKKSALFVTPALLTGNIWAQTGVIKGRVYDRMSNEPVPFANVYIDSTTTGTVSGLDGFYRLEGLLPGTYNLVCSFVGFSSERALEVQVGTAKPAQVDFALTATSTRLGEVVITAPSFARSEESPASMRTISATEIYRNPGGNRDISRVIQILPGVSSTLSFRNDIIVRGGAPGENRFYLDGIEVPNINHFATQGSSGGPVGMINVNFIREVDFHAGAFPVNRGNALSSVIEFRQTEGNDERLNGTFTIGSSDVGLTLDGPITDRSTFLVSVRRSYLQLLFKALALPFLPTYNDMQFKQTIRIDSRNTVTWTGLGAIDDFELNTSVNDGLTDSGLIERNNYILGYLPVNTQWNYAVGVKWRHFSGNSYRDLIVSRNHLDNQSVKYRDNIEQPDQLLLDYQSAEIENKVRFENTWRSGGWKWMGGAGYEDARYTNSTFNRKVSGGKAVTIDFDSELRFGKYAFFSQIAKTFEDSRWTLSAGLRTDFNDYSREMSNPFRQLSPRLSASFALTEKTSLNFNAGRYFQLPPYTVMGYRDSNGVLVNKENGITYIRGDQVVAGVEYQPTFLSKISLECFYKTYDGYPFLIGDSLSLGNLGGDFGVIGNEPVTSSSTGRCYGIELLMQQKLSSSVYGILSYTFYRSVFSDRNGDLVSSAWDNRNIISLTAGKKLKKGWEVGLKFRLLGGAPYTPYDRTLSALKTNWDVNRQGLPDWKRLNQERNPVSHTLDARLDKRWYFLRWTLDVYVDVQNMYNFQAKLQPFLDVEYDASGNPVTDPSNPLAYTLKEIENTSGTILPSIGLMLEF